MKAKKIVIPVVIVAGIAAITIAALALSGKNAAPAYTDASLVERKDVLQNYISVTGNVESSSLTKVYSTLSYPVESVEVDIGDKVKKGDVLCKIDTSDLQTKILEAQANIDSSNTTSEYQISQAEKNYNDASDRLNNGTNSQIVSATQSLNSAKTNLDNAQKDYGNAVEMSKQDRNTQLQNSELNLENAKKAVIVAQEAYDKAKKDSDDEDYYSIKSLNDTLDEANKVLTHIGTTDNEVERAYNAYNKAYAEYTRAYYYPETIPVDKSLVDYSSALDAAEKKLSELTEKYKIKNAQDEYEKALKAYNEAKNKIDEDHKNALSAAEKNLETAKSSVTSAEIALQSVKDSTGTGLDNYKTQLSAAQLSYENAKKNLEIAENEASASVASLKAAAERERTTSNENNSQLITLENLKAKLDDAVITAPCDGTITMVGAFVGNVPTTTIFTIEDETELIVKAKVREFDIPHIEVGLPVTIKSDATSESYEGIVTKIAPTAAKNADGSDAGTAMFDIEVAVTSKDVPLKIGMTAKMNIITEEKSNVLTVMLDSITSDDDGNDIVYVAEKGAAGYTVKSVKVTVGLQTDFLAEISGEGISEGMIVINNTSLITDGQTVAIDEADLGIAESTEVSSTETSATEGTDA